MSVRLCSLPDLSHGEAEKGLSQIGEFNGSIYFNLIQSFFPSPHFPSFPSFLLPSFLFFFFAAIHVNTIAVTLTISRSASL